MRATRFQRLRPGGAAFGAAVMLLAATALASGQALVSSPGSGTPAPGLGLTAPGGGVGSLSPTRPIQSPLNLPSSAAPVAPPVPQTPTQPGASQVALYLAARFGPDQPYIPGGLIWRIYSDRPNANGVFRLVREDRTSAPAFLLTSGGYVVHVAFGQATATRRITLNSDTVREIIDLPAGGIRLEGRVGGVRIPTGQISFDIFPGSQFDVGDKRPLTQGVLTGEVMIVPEGTYTIVSNYGDGNAVVRSDVRVRSGQVTDVTVTHRAAVITLKLVASEGGDAIANTAWSVLTPGGDVIKESIGAFPRVVLAEGEYKAIARNEGKVFEHDFKVVTGVDSEIAVRTR